MRLTSLWPARPTPTVQPRGVVSETGRAQNGIRLQLELQRQGFQLGRGLSAPLSIRFAVSRRLMLEFEGDQPLYPNQRGLASHGSRRLGSASAGMQLEKEKRPGFSLAYYASCPTARFSAKRISKPRSILISIASEQE